MMKRERLATGMLANRSHGFVVRLRLSPKHVMAGIDCMDAAGLRVEGMSLSAALKRGIVVALNTMLDGKVIKEREGFEYNDMVARFPDVPSLRKIGVGHALVVQDHSMEFDSYKGPSLSTPEVKAVRIIKGEDRLVRRQTELLFKQEANPANWDKDDERKLQKVKDDLAKLRAFA